MAYVIDHACWNCYWNERRFLFCTTCWRMALISAGVVGLAMTVGRYGLTRTAP
jgi:hypothetical protein